MRIFLICIFFLYGSSLILQNSSIAFCQESIQTENLNSESSLSETKENYEYKAEVNRLLDIIINYLYTQKELFIREMVSNSVDALEKIRLQSLSNSDLLVENSDLFIKIYVDKEKQTITILDTGIGMTKSDLINNLGTVAKSGTNNFLEAMTEVGDINLIGQFGVGFYSAFLVADKVTVYSKNPNDDQYIWESSADSHFTISKDPEGNSLGRGTKIVLHIKQDATEFLDISTLSNLVEKFSQFMPYPIYIWKTKKIPFEPENENIDLEGTPDDNDEFKEDLGVDITDDDEDDKQNKVDDIPKHSKIVYDWEHINSNKPIWLRSKSEVSDMEYSEFYKTITKDTLPPLSWNHFSAEGEIDFKALLYIPQTPLKNVIDSLSKKRSDIKLYSRRVLVAESLENFLPQYLSFIKGVIDSDDIPLNVAREQLQEERLLKAISKKAVRKSLELLKTMLKESQDYKNNLRNEIKEITDPDIKELKEKQLDSPTTFDKFWDNYGTLLQIGCYDDNANANKIAALLQFKTNINPNEYVTLDQHLEDINDQEVIYYISGQSDETIIKNPLLQIFNKKQIPVIFASNSMSEACLHVLSTYKEKRLVSIEKENVDFKANEAETSRFEKLKAMYNPLTNWFQNLLTGKVKSVELSKTLVNDPCIVTSSNLGYSPSMERTLKSQHTGDKELFNILSTMKTFQINPNHPLILSMLEQINEYNKSSQNLDDIDIDDNNNNTASSKSNSLTISHLERIGNMLFKSALISSGYELDDYQSMANDIYTLLSNANNLDPNSPILELDDEYINLHTIAEQKQKDEDDISNSSIDPEKFENEIDDEIYNLGSKQINDLDDIQINIPGQNFHKTDEL